MITPRKIRLGICMAGAVSAGAYTAGVIDYLIETLERWQLQKNIIRKKIDNNMALTDAEKLVPLHDVVIEVLSGASAGGMTAAVLAYSFNDDSYITKRDGNIIPGNYHQPLSTDKPTKLYNSWINMVDEDDRTTFSKLMDTTDVGDLKELKAILNSKPIDDIAGDAVPETIDFKKAPPYISPHLSIILSVTNLEGIPIDIRFSNVSDNARNVLHMHSGFLHYQFNQQLLNDIDYPAEVIGNGNKSNLASAAMATGAFPFGLANRRIVVNKVFFEGFKQNLKANRNLDVNMNLRDKQDAYIFTAVDGGAINNEPMGTTVKILNAKCDLAKKADPSFSDENYMILIDPFPSVTNPEDEANFFKEPKPYNLLQQAFKIFKAFRNQSSFKQDDLFSGLEMTHRRYLIYPARRRFYFLACGLVEGFSGFLKKAFRTHDYQLGRKNCQTFLRYYFGEEVSVFENTTGITLTQSQKEIWRYDFNYGKKDEPPLWKLPLIPDMLVLDKKIKKEIPDEIAVPGYNGITDIEFAEATSLINKRVTLLTEKAFPLIHNEIKKLNKFAGWCAGIFSGFLKRKIVNFIAGKAAEYLHKTLLPQIIKQGELVSRYAAILEKKGNLYQKSKGVYATVAVGGELVISKIQDDALEETRNVAGKGDYIVTGITKSGERWIVKPEDFHKRYNQVQGDYYEPKDAARVYALQVTAANIYQYRLTELQDLISNPGRAIYIEAKWEESQLISLDSSFLVCPPDKSEVYRIAKSVFDETYERVK